MLFSKPATTFSRFIKSITTPHKNVLQLVSIMSFVVLFSMQPAQAAKPVPISTEKNYLRVESSVLYEKTDLEVTSIGIIGFDNNMQGNIDLSFLKSAIDGDALVANAGAGYGFKWYVSFYAGLGITLGYNLDEEEFIAGYYPDIGILVDITKSFGLSLSAKRYFNVYDSSNSEDVVMLGVVFR